MQIHKKRLSLKQKIRIGEKLQKVTIIRKKLRTDNKFIWKWHSKRYCLILFKKVFLNSSCYNQATQRQWRVENGFC